jgi:hypothetical protein
MTRSAAFSSAAFLFSSPDRETASTEAVDAVTLELNLFPRCRREMAQETACGSLRTCAPT